MNMKALNQHQKKAFMWYKVKELFEKGLNKTQISEEVGIHRKTVRKYLSMTEEEFYSWIEKPKNLPPKLNDYYGYVHNILEEHPYLSAAQVEDRLKENFQELPMVNSKTVYNFVQSIRVRYGIKKQGGKKQRQFEKLPDPDYGQQAQADFGEYIMQTKEGSRKKVYFFVMLLCRSRYKFVYFQINPFTTRNTIEAHEKAFVFFNGQPREVLYDQDKVLITDENLGDVLLTQDFNTYCNQMDFMPVFCRKSDPQSKGKVENAVKYVKYNFLRGRNYNGIEKLNQSCIAWLNRTANAKEHSGTKKIPASEWKIERDYLLPLKRSQVNTGVRSLKYKVRKDNTINYRSNFYTLPLGTYQGPESWVFIKEDQDQLFLYTIENELLAIHSLCHQRGMVVRNTDHIRDKSQNILMLKEEVIKMIPDQGKGQLYIDMLHKKKPRYVRDSLLLIKKHIPTIGKDFVIQSLNFCIENNVYNANRLIEIARHYEKESLVYKKNDKTILPEITIRHGLDAIDLVPETSKITTYEKIL